MDEMDVPQMKKEVESLKYQLAYKREMSSKSIPERELPIISRRVREQEIIITRTLLRILKWIEEGVPNDPFLNPELMKNNPWVERGKCSIL